MVAFLVSLPNYKIIMKATAKTYTVQEAKERLEAYCAYQERCHREVVTKLRTMGMIPLAIDDIVVHLIQNGFLNEERFAKSFARGKFRIKKWGRVRMRKNKLLSEKRTLIKLKLNWLITYCTAVGSRIWFMRK